MLTNEVNKLDVDELKLKVDEVKLNSSYVLEIHAKRNAARFVAPK